MSMKTLVFISLLILAIHPRASSQDIKVILQKAKAKIESVNDYEASGRMKTNVAFLKVPVANIKVWFKKPNRLKVKSEKGISFIPKGAVTINMSNLIGTNNYLAIDAGKEKIGGVEMRIAKLLPADENSDIVLSTVYIDPVSSLIYKVRTTTKDNGSYELEMTYGKYSAYSLPDKIIFSFNTKDYKLPKGVTFDFDDGTKTAPAEKTKNKKGRAEITFKSYIINRGVSDAVFN